MAKAKKTERDNQTQRERQAKDKTRKLNQWKQDRMKGAIEEYRQVIDNGGVPNMRLLARAWNVPKSTLQRRVKGNGQSEHTIGRKTIISIEDEVELKEMIIVLGKRGFPLRMGDIKQLAYQFATKKGIRGFSTVQEKAGYKWLWDFLRRNRNLRIRKPEALSANRAAGFNPTVVNTWFKKYQDTIERLGLENVPDHIWNCDETGLQDHFLSTRVVAEAGLPCFEITAGEKGETSTCLSSINAGGGYGPIIFKGKRMKAEWVFGAPENTFLRMTDNGWINTELFTEWGKFFLQSLPKDYPRPHLLLVDGHSSHVYNIEFLNLTKDNNVCV